MRALALLVALATAGCVRPAQTKPVLQNRGGRECTMEERMECMWSACRVVRTRSC